ncbi:MAG: DedA family protein [Alistipes sp.]|nr:DedA family protein [Alistipes sp.]MBO7263033.1 DedA family protein [Alistipes sp.]
MIKKLYDWVLSWSGSRWGWLALFIIALCESSWFPIPPDILLIALCLGATKKSFRFAGITLLGSIIGAMLGYAIGHFLWTTPAGEATAIANFFYENVFSVESFDNVGAMYDKYNFWIVFTAGFTPLPYKLFTIAGGMFDINFVMFLIASTISRGLRFFLIGWLIWRYGQPIKVFIDKYFNLLATLFTVLLIGFFALAVSIFDNGDKSDAEPTATTEVITE